MREHETWLLWARYDLVMAELALKHSEPVISPAIYHAQQCTEKSFKAYLLFKEYFPIPRIHDLERLLELCLFYDEEFSVLRDIAIGLNPHVTASRYPDSAFMQPDFTSALIFLSEANEVFTFVSSKTLEEEK